jgi:hypothetical protein
VLNRYFEILKWQNLASYIKPISVLEATKQACCSNCRDFTPNGVGEYAGKALYYENTKQNKSFS